MSASGFVCHILVGHRPADGYYARALRLGNLVSGRVSKEDAAKECAASVAAQHGQTLVEFRFIAASMAYARFEPDPETSEAA